MPASTVVVKGSGCKVVVVSLALPVCSVTRQVQGGVCWYTGGQPMWEGSHRKNCHHRELNSKSVRKGILPVQKGLSEGLYHYPRCSCWIWHSAHYYHLFRGLHQWLPVFAQATCDLAHYLDPLSDSHLCMGYSWQCLWYSVYSCQFWTSVCGNQAFS